jgi:hypothetical protein
MDAHEEHGTHSCCYIAGCQFGRVDNGALRWRQWPMVLLAKVNVPSGELTNPKLTVILCTAHYAIAIFEFIEIDRLIKQYIRYLGVESCL